jgi:hypothetical protein
MPSTVEEADETAKAKAKAEARILQAKAAYDADHAAFVAMSPEHRVVALDVLDQFKNSKNADEWTAIYEGSSGPFKEIPGLRGIVINTTMYPDNLPKLHAELAAYHAAQNAVGFHEAEKSVAATVGGVSMPPKPTVTLAEQIHAIIGGTASTADKMSPELLNVCKLVSGLPKFEKDYFIMSVKLHDKNPEEIAKKALATAERYPEFGVAWREFIKLPMGEQHNLYKALHPQAVAAEATKAAALLHKQPQKPAQRPPQRSPYGKNFPAPISASVAEKEYFHDALRLASELSPEHRYVLTHTLHLLDTNNWLRAMRNARLIEQSQARVPELSDALAAAERLSVKSRRALLLLVFLLLQVSLKGWVLNYPPLLPLPMLPYHQHWRHYRSVIYLRMILFIQHGRCFLRGLLKHPMSLSRLSPQRQQHCPYRHLVLPIQCNSCLLSLRVSQRRF